MIRSKTFCKFFQTQSSFPLQSFFLRKKKDFRFNLGYKLASVSFHFTNILPNKKNWHKVSFINYQNYFFKMSEDWHCVPTERNQYMAKVFTHITFLRNEKSPHQQIITSPHQQITTSSNYHIKIPTFTIQAFIFW